MTKFHHISLHILTPNGSHITPRTKQKENWEKEEVEDSFLENRRIASDKQS